jgi:hypothetical protein
MKLPGAKKDKLVSYIWYFSYQNFTLQFQNVLRGLATHLGLHPNTTV